MTALYACATLIVLTTGLLYLFPASAALLGTILLIWSTFGILRILNIAELSMFSHEKQPAGGSSLPGKLISNLTGKKRSDEAKNAVKTFNRATLIWILFAALYGFWIIFSAAFPEDHPQHEMLRSDIITTIKITFGEDIAPHRITILSLAKGLSIPLICAITFITAQTCVQENRKRIFLFALGILIFIGSLMDNCIHMRWLAEGNMFPGALWWGYGPGTIELFRQMELLPPGPLSALQIRYYQYGTAGLLFMAPLFLYMSVFFARALFFSRKNALYAAAGIAVLTALYTADAFLEYTPRFIPIWFSGWMLLAICFAGSQKSSDRIYRLHQ